MPRRWFDDNRKDKVIASDIGRVISASLALRDRRDLIEGFVAGMGVGSAAREVT